jgi:hypothetical protein
VIRQPQNLVDYLHLLLVGQHLDVAFLSECSGLGQQLASLVALSQYLLLLCPLCLLNRYWSLMWLAAEDLLVAQFVYRTTAAADHEHTNLWEQNQLHWLDPALVALFAAPLV